MNYQLWKFYGKYRIFDMFRGNPKYMNYKKIKNIMIEELNEIVIYENFRQKSKTKNIEHVVCQKYAKRKKEWKNIKFDFHNLYLAIEIENTKRNDKKFCLENSKETKDTYPIKKQDYPFIVSSISYFSIQHPNLFYEHFHEFVSNEQKWKEMVKETICQLIQNDELNQKLIYRNRKIGELQLNHNPFIKYPILYYYVFNINLNKQQKSDLWKLSFYNFVIS